MLEKFKGIEIEPGIIQMTGIGAKINELVDAINELGAIVDEFTGSAPNFRPVSNEPADLPQS